MYCRVGRVGRRAASAIGAAFAGVVGGRREEGEGDTKSKLRKDRPTASGLCAKEEGERERTNEQAISLARPAWMWSGGHTSEEREREMGQIE